MKVVTPPLLVITALLILCSPNQAAATATGCFAAVDFVTPSRGSVGNGSGLQSISSRIECLAEATPARSGQTFTSEDSLAGATSITMCLKSSGPWSLHFLASIDGKEYFADSFAGSTEPAKLAAVGRDGQCVQISPAPFIRVVADGSSPSVTIHLQAVYS